MNVTEPREVNLGNSPNKTPRFSRVDQAGRSKFVREAILQDETGEGVTVEIWTHNNGKKACLAHGASCFAKTMINPAGHIV